ncbi:MAG: HAMP domain-containing histidine kinase [Saprospiraceae bacterium]|nr:HAMP domain-containing histidine kinase [Saprospiraceae bacterium]
MKNAIDAVAGSDDSIIQVGVRGVDYTVRFSFKDSGLGIPSELREQIFIPFFTTKEEGSGIGLSLCRQIVYQHGGSLKLFSSEGEGTGFIVEI